MKTSFLFIAVAFGGAVTGQRFWSLALGDAPSGGGVLFSALALGFWLGHRFHRGELGVCLAFVPLAGLWVLKAGILLGIGHHAWLIAWTVGFTALCSLPVPRHAPPAQWVLGLALGGALAWAGEPVLFGYWFLGASVLLLVGTASPWPARSITALALLGITLLSHEMQRHHQRGATVVQGPLARWVLQSDLSDSWGRDTLLFGNGRTAFESSKEPGSLQCLSRVPLEWLSHHDLGVQKVAVIGPELGMVVRELVEAPHITHVTVVNPDDGADALALNHTGLRTYNRDSLLNPKVHRLYRDPLQWAVKSREQFDAILVALPTPRTWRASRYFSAEFFGALLNRSEVLAVSAGRLPETKMLGPWMSALKATFLKLGKQPRLIGDERSDRAFFLVPAQPDWKAVSFFEERQMLPSSSSPQVCQHNPGWKSEPAAPLTLSRLVLPDQTLRYQLSQLTLLPE